MRLIRLLTFVALAVGCSEPTAPALFSGTFTLRSIGVAPVPSAQGTYASAPIVFVDTIAFTDSIPFPGTIMYARSSLVQYPGRAMQSFQLRYAAYVRGDTLDIPDCPIGATCVAIAYAPHLGVLRGDTLRLLARPMFLGVELEQLFVRTK